MTVGRVTDKEFKMIMNGIYFPHDALYGPGGKITDTVSSGIALWYLPIKFTNEKYIFVSEVGNIKINKTFCEKIINEVNDNYFSGPVYFFEVKPKVLLRLFDEKTNNMRTATRIEEVIGQVVYIAFELKEITK